MRKKIDWTLGMKKYDMRKYWSKRANFSKNVYQSVCIYEVPYQFNELMDYVQKTCFFKLLEKCQNIKDKNVLEIGCGVGRWSQYMIDKGAVYTGIDISQEMIKIAKKRIPKGIFYVSTGENLNFKDESFDLVFSITVLHHIPYEKKEKVIKEMCRVVKVGGYIIIMEDIYFKKPKKTFYMFPLKVEEWIKLFERNGCEYLHLIKHKFMQGYMEEFVKKFPNLTNNKIFLNLGILLERVMILAPIRFFTGVGIIFKRKKSHSF